MSVAEVELDACFECLRRTALVAALSGRIEQEWRLRRGRPQLLALPDHELLEWSRDAAAATAFETFVADAALDACVAAGLSVVCRCSPRYPAVLRDLPDPPAVLHVRGDLAVLTGAVVDAGSDASHPPVTSDPASRHDPAPHPPGPFDPASRHNPAPHSPGPPDPPGLGDVTPRPADLPGPGGPREGRSRSSAASGHARVAVAVVGARKATAAGLEVARSLGRGLAAAGVPVVSGMALGVDAAAHAGALEAGGPTVAVLATGADRPYPARHAALHARIAQAGCVVAELPPGTAPRRWSFPARNRIIAALAGVTVVVEGGDRSGSLITADFAADLGRVVAAVPGPVTSPLSAGPNLLLKVGADLVRDTRDVLDLLAALPDTPVPDHPDASDGGRHAPGAPHPAEGRRAFEPVVIGGRAPDATTPAVVPVPDDLDPRTRATLARIEAGEDTLAALVRSADDAFAVSVDLGELEVRRLVRRLPDGRYLRRLA